MTDQPDRRRALAFNAVGPAVNAAGCWLPLSARRAVADAVLEATADSADGYCPHCGRGDAGPSPDAYEELRQQAAQAEAELDQMRKACDAMASKADDLAREAATTNNDALLHLATGYGEAARHIAATPSRNQPKDTP